MVAVNIPFTIPTIRSLDAFLLSLFAIVIAKAIRPIIAHKITVDVVKANKIVPCSLQIPPVYIKSSGHIFVTSQSLMKCI